MPCTTECFPGRSFMWLFGWLVCSLTLHWLHFSIWGLRGMLCNLDSLHMLPHMACLERCALTLVAFLTTIWHGWAIAWWASLPFHIGWEVPLPPLAWVGPHLILLTGKQGKEGEDMNPNWLKSMFQQVPSPFLKRPKTYKRYHQKNTLTAGTAPFIRTISHSSWSAGQIFTLSNQSSCDWKTIRETGESSKAKPSLKVHQLLLSADRLLALIQAGCFLVVAT